MKGLLVLVVLATALFAGYNYVQVQELKQEVVGLQVKLKQQRQQSNTDRVLADAVRRLAAARAALGRVDTSQARAEAQRTLDDMAAAADDAKKRTEPALKWLEMQANDLSNRINGAHATPAKPGAT